MASGESQNSAIPSIDTSSSYTMQKILITGATGTVGLETIKAFHELGMRVDLVAGVRDIIRVPAKLAGYGLDFVRFDFTDPPTYEIALEGCNTLFLLRPPHLAAVKKYFEPLIERAVAAKVEHIVFLSVQGAPGSRFIPHHKIEKLIVKSGVAYTFLRPAYFMQNFTTTLRDDLLAKRQIYLPADNAKFTLIDVRDIGAVAAQVLAYPDQHANQAYDLTSDEPLTFIQMAKKLSEGLGYRINYESPTLWEFFWKKKGEGNSIGFILVLILLHYLPRFQKPPPLSRWVERITGKPPITFEKFVCDYADELSN